MSGNQTNGQNGQAVNGDNQSTTTSNGSQSNTQGQSQPAGQTGGNAQLTNGVHVNGDVQGQGGNRDSTNAHPNNNEASAGADQRGSPGEFVQNERSMRWE
ncbi:hypothetical protein PMZ80_001454 [Knufia obscura]|uniref:Uncharacterized protein n=2 Tax=Knufia TaxID=430999 RepID=A0AAN8EH66_9EURO|nr:hypothetical protein PMZ80_001454 [Knufia obscura]KAK5955724.1 hypothetical protein OHC33_003365 [Knufia fluminis]